MKVTFLGTADGHTSPKREHSGILVQVEEGSLLLDCGAAAARFLLNKGYSPDVPEILWISHMHSDHNGQFSALIQSLWLRGRRAPLTVFAPELMVAQLADWLEKSLLFPDLIGFPIRWLPIRPEKKTVQGLFSFRPFPTLHLANLASYFKKAYPQTCFDCFGTAFTVGRDTCVYSSDLAHPSELRPVLKGKKIKALFCEMTHFPERDLFTELAQHQINSLWVTHYPETLVGKEEYLISIAREEKFRGSVFLMHDRESRDL